MLSARIAPAFMQSAVAGKQVFKPILGFVTRQSFRRFARHRSIAHAAFAGRRKLLGLRIALLHRDLFCRFLVSLLGELKRLSRVFKSLSGVLVSRLVILLTVMLHSGTVGMSGSFVKLGGLLVRISGHKNIAPCCAITIIRYRFSRINAVTKCVVSVQFVLCQTGYGIPASRFMTNACAVSRITAASMMNR